MQEDNNNQCHIKFKGGCFGCLLEIVGVIGICYIGGCEWARGRVGASSVASARSTARG